MLGLLDPIGVLWFEVVRALVRELNESAPSTWYGEDEGTGRNGMNVLGGKEGCRRRMYHPRLGLCIDQQTVPLGLCCRGSS